MHEMHFCKTWIATENCYYKKLLKDKLISSCFFITFFGKMPFKLHFKFSKVLSLLYSSWLLVIYFTELYFSILTTIIKISTCDFFFNIFTKLFFHLSINIATNVLVFSWLILKTVSFSTAPKTHIFKLYYILMPNTCSLVKTTHIFLFWLVRIINGIFLKKQVLNQNV